MTGQYDPKAEGQALTDANTARLARDPFATSPAAAEYGFSELDPPDGPPPAPADDQAPVADADDTAALSAAITGNPWRPDGGSQTSIDGTVTPTPDGNPNLEGVKDKAPDVCGADTATGQCQRAPHAPEYPHVSGKYAAQADADLPNPNPPAVDLFRADWPYPQLSATDFQALYATAAETIKTRGYYPHEASGYADEPGISITGALKAAATAYVKALGPDDTADQQYWAAADITEELETRLSAVLYVFGQVHNRTGISDLSDILVSWSLAHFDIGPNPGLAAAVSLLEQAARMFAALEDVTEAPEPGRM